jgi:hypothetical protein
MTRARWWSRSRGLPVAAYSEWRTSLVLVPGREARILAWATTPTGYCVGSPAALSIGDQSGFTHLGWHEIERGSWNAETARLSWVCHADAEGRARRGWVDLVEPARLPELFAERIAATIVFERFVPLTASVEGGVMVSARRDLSGAADRIAWHVSPTRGLDWRDPAVRAEAKRVLAGMRSEYDSAPTGW